jgi:NADPH:quinone reductase-like Zn-dependent oxidoreductase
MASLPTESQSWTYTNGYPHSLSLTSHKINKDTSNILLKIEACALNPVDIQMMNTPIIWKNSQDPKGTVCDFSGTVISPGKSKDFQAGDEVMGLTLSPFTGPTSGGLSQYAEINPSSSVLVKKPKEWSFEKAAAISLVWLTAKVCIDSVAPFVEGTSSKKVAILGGSSATGIYSILLAKRKGWKVVSTSSGKNRDFIVNDLKADEHVDYTKGDVRGGVEAFGPDAVIDCVGGTECIGLAGSKRYTTIVGDKTGRLTMGGPFTYYDYSHPVVAVTQWVRWVKGRVGLGESYDVVILAPEKGALEEAKSMLKEENIFVDSVFAFEDAKEAFERLNTGRAKGKVVVRVGERSRL